MIARRVAWALAVACSLMAIPTAVLMVVQIGEFTPGDTFVQGGVGGPAFVIASLAFAIIGALVVSRVPGNSVGWIFCLIGFLVGIGTFSYEYADRALYGSPGSLPAGEAAAWLQNLGLPPAFALLALVLLLFPDGRLPSRAWLPALWVAQWAEPLAGAFLLVIVSFVGALAALVIRYRRAGSHDRVQLRWVAFGGVLFLAVYLVTLPLASILGLSERSSGTTAITMTAQAAFAALPVAIGYAVLRHRLYDIDVVLNRTLVYGSLTATLAAIYFGAVLLLQLVLSAVTAGNGLAVAASTLAVAALFRPARSRIQATVDRRFFRRKYDAVRTLEAFGARLRDELDLDALHDELRAVIAGTMQPAHVSLWLREPAR